MRIFDTLFKRAELLRESSSFCLCVLLCNSSSPVSHSLLILVCLARTFVFHPHARISSARTLLVRLCIYDSMCVCVCVCVRAIGASSCFSV